MRKHNSMTVPELRTYFNDVVDATYKKPAYEAIDKEAVEVKETGSVFEAACVAAANGGSVLIEQRNIKKLKFLEALDRMATALQLNVTDDVTYVTNAHFDFRKQPSRSDEPLPDPVLDFVNPGVLNGTAVGKVKDFSRGVRTVAVEYSEDNGLTWKNGTYSTGKKFTLSGLESRKEYLVRVVCHGTVQRTSNPSKALPVFVN
ncbi:MAG: fibronectin type III domain-containing protein [Saprospiraceae bacterium]|nr:fibronectin type III domain-containing protein [Saprospiraceae bacterium]